jgi:hypothetical protein
VAVGGVGTAAAARLRDDGSAIEVMRVCCVNVLVPILLPLPPSLPPPSLPSLPPFLPSLPPLPPALPPASHAFFAERLET